MLVSGSHSCAVFLVSAQCVLALHRLPMLIRESGNSGIMCAKFFSLGKSFKVKFAVPLECEYFQFGTFTVIIDALLFALATVALGVTKVLAVPESATADSYFMGKLQHESFECTSTMLDFKF